MDTGIGNFEQLHAGPEVEKSKERMDALRRALVSQPHVFRVGEELEIKSSKFRVKHIGNKFMELELLPRLD